MTMLGVVRVRGEKRVGRQIRDTLETMRLRQRHACVIIQDTPQNRGQLQACKDFVTFGTVTPETQKLVEDKRGERTVDGKLKPYFRLLSPRGGFERKGIKKPFTEGGAVGWRGSMDELLKRMV